MIKAIIFDFAGVIGSEVYWGWVRENVPDLVVVRGKFRHALQRVEKGEISEKEFVKFLADNTGLKENQIWPELFHKVTINQDLLQMIQSLKKRYKIGLLSNHIYEWLNEIITHYQLFDSFDEIIISSQHGVLKPEPEIFHKMLDKLQLSNNEVIFIDDRENNVDVSNSLGIKALIYIDNETLKNDLARLGVEI